MPRVLSVGAFALLAVLVLSCGGGDSSASRTALGPPEDEDQNFVEWVRLAGKPIESLAPGRFDGIERVGHIVGDARVIAVGDPVYGAKETALVKRRLFEYLVRHKGVRTLVAEVGWSEAIAIDEYLHTGEGDPDELLAALRTWTWNTGEALTLVKWMRRYNERATQSGQLHFFGADMIYTSSAASALRAYLEKVDPEFLARVDTSLEFFGQPESESKAARLRSRDGGALQLDVERALDRLWRRRMHYAEATSKHEWEIAERHGQVLRQSVDLWRASVRNVSPISLRERYLAENVRWTLDREETGEQIFLWSHNSRVSVEALRDGERMGRHLQRLLGSDLVVIGILFNQGSFRARKGGSAVVEVELGPAPMGTVEHSLAKVGPEMLIVDLRRSTDLVDQWLQTEYLTREAGIRYSDPNSMMYRRILGRRFDALVWIDTTTASSLTSAWRRSPAALRRDDGG